MQQNLKEIVFMITLDDTKQETAIVVCLLLDFCSWLMVLN